MYIFSAAETKQMEINYIQEMGVDETTLVESAADALFEQICKLRQNNTPIVIFAGSHNNGADALALSRLLFLAGYPVEVYLFNTNGHLSNACEVQRGKLLKECDNIIFHEVSKKLDLPILNKNHLVIDGIFGIGLQGPVTNSFALLIKYINGSDATVVSIDIPSGMMCEDNTETMKSQIVRADYTFTFQSIKPAFLLEDCQEFIGKCIIIDIGIRLSKQLENPQYELDEIHNMAPLLKPRNPFGHKGTFGHGLLIAGSYGMAGAAVIAAQSAIKSGMGKLTVHTPSANNEILQISVPQAVLHNEINKFNFSTPEQVLEYKAIAIGPGIGTHEETAKALIEQIRRSNVPMVLDADALNLLARNKNWMQQLPKGTILTPHEKEFDRIFGDSPNNYSRLKMAKEMAIHWRINIILKGHYSIIASPEGKIYFNTTGNSGMATAGSGDSLTGILLSLLAQGYYPTEACRLGCFIHGMAGDLAAEEFSEEAMTVIDLVNKLPNTFKELKKNNRL